MSLKIKKAALVYQAGIANVFQCERTTTLADTVLGPRKARRLLQGTFRDCEMFACGLKAAGTIVRTFACNRAGDVTDNEWTINLANAPFLKRVES